MKSDLKGQVYQISWIIMSLPVVLESYDCEEFALKTREELIQAWDLRVKPKKKRIHSSVYTSTVLEVDIWLINIHSVFSFWA